MFQYIFKSLVLIMVFMAQAEARILEELVDPNASYTGPTVEERIALMDTDKNGFADVHEIRQFLEKQHGKDYKQALLAKLEANAMPKSCGTAPTELFTEE